MSYFIRTSWGQKAPPRDYPAPTAAEAGHFLSLLGRDGVLEYEIYRADGTRMEWVELMEAWRAEQEAPKGPQGQKRHGWRIGSLAKQ